MLWALGSILFAAALAPRLHRLLGSKAVWLLAAAPLSAAGVFLWGEPQPVSWPWAASVGVELTFRADGLSALMAVLIGAIGGLVVIYAGGYMKDQARQGYFLAVLLFFIAAMLGLVLSDNLLLLFVCWELTSISSFLLIGFYHDKPYARDAAKQALLTTALGGLALLGGLIVMMLMATGLGLSMTEAMTLSVLFEHGQALQASPLYPTALLLILVGCFTKSAQVPFHYWLASAMAGPTPVSAMLHSATMVKAGVFLLARLNPVLGGTVLWMTLLTSFGAVTMVTGAVMAVGQRDLKAILAYTTVSVLGTLVMLLGIGSETAITAMVVFLTAHALYKASLFMVAGNVDHEAGTRDILRVSGLRRVMPITAAAALIAALSKAGAPPALGYLGKKLTLQAKFGADALGQWLILAAVITNIAMVAIALTVALRPFWGAVRPTPKPAHEVPFSMWLGPLALALAGMLVGLVPAFFEKGLGVAAASAIAGEPLQMELKLWAGLSVESMLLIGLSIGAFALGYFVYNRLPVNLPATLSIGKLRPLTPTALYETSLSGLMKVAAWHTRWIQSGYLRVYVAVIVLFAVAVILPWSLLAAGFSVSPGATRPYPHEILIGLLIMVGGLGVVLLRSAMGAVLSLGLAGLGLALIFGLFGGPDLAITQLLVETLVLVLLAVVLSQLPRAARQVSRSTKIVNGIIAALGGGAVTTLVLLATGTERSRQVAEFFLQNAAPEAFGRNVVNVILVDFRALDTLGEVTVVAAAAVAAIGLLGRDRTINTTRERPVIDWLPLRTISRPVTVLLVAVAVIVLLRGHNEPGGGFIAGLLAGIGFVVHALTFGPYAARQLLRMRPIVLAGAGLLVASGSGLFALADDQPYMTGQWWGELLHIGKVGTVLLFDLGVCLIVAGAACALSFRLIEEGSSE
jgi:multicomponent Na+:H+ antiporter subunit A